MRLLRQLRSSGTSSSASKALSRAKGNHPAPAFRLHRGMRSAALPRSTDRCDTARRCTSPAAHQCLCRPPAALPAWSPPGRNPRTRGALVVAGPLLTHCCCLLRRRLLRAPDRCLLCCAAALERLSDPLEAVPRTGWRAARVRPRRGRARRRDHPRQQDHHGRRRATRAGLRTRGWRRGRRERPRGGGLPGGAHLPSVSRAARASTSAASS